MSGPRDARRASAGRAGNRVVEALPVILAALAEGAWVAAVYAVVEATAHRETTFGPLTMALAAGLGLLLARRYGPGLGDRWPGIALALVIGSAVFGWLSDAASVAALLRLDPVAAIRVHPGGWLLGLAVLRGMAHAEPGTSEGALERLVLIGVPGLAVPVLVGGALPEPWQSEALDAQVVDIAIFLVAATLALAVTRLARVASSGGFAWRRNRAWIALVALIGVGVVAASLPASVVVGPVVRLAIALLVVPFFFIGTLAGLTQIRLRSVVSMLVLAGVFLVIVAIAGSPSGQRTGTGPPGVSGVGASDSPFVPLAGGGLLLVAVVVGILVLARIWMRETLRPVESDVDEERTIDATPAERIAAPRGPRRAAVHRGTPTDAPSAYLALLGDLERRDELRRQPAESPAEHARRLRRTGRGAVGLDLLAADYALARFADAHLTAREERRAIGRWRHLRRTLGHQDHPAEG